jgi:oligopeptide/dipeptide ABC transporter ATP-binding protein
MKFVVYKRFAKESRKPLWRPAKNAEKPIRATIRVYCCEEDGVERGDSQGFAREATAPLSPNPDFERPLLQVRGLKVAFPVKGGGLLRAVDGVDLNIGRGEILGLVGESGCGKTVFSLALLGLVPLPGRVLAGSVLWDGSDVVGKRGDELRRVRGSMAAMIFQNPQASLNPVRTVGAQLSDILKLHRSLSHIEALEEAEELLRLVQIPDPKRALTCYPHHFSVGMCQRLMIAMALSCRPQLLIADEPTASLDVTVQAQILDLLLRVHERFDMSVLLISHDLAVIANTCHRIAVMYLGRIVEEAISRDLFASPLHPYTQALLESICVPDPSSSRKAPPVMGDVPSAVDIPSGCRFRLRCPKAFADCSAIDPRLKPVNAGSLGNGQGREVACLLYEAPSSSPTEG